MKVAYTNSYVYVRQAFTAVEIVIVVVLIGILATLAIPAFHKVHLNSRAAVIVNDFRIFADAFNRYNFEHGAWPPADWVQGAQPAGMSPYMPHSWTKNADAGGYYAFDFIDGFPTVILQKNGLERELLERVEKLMDDGDPANGQIHGNTVSLDFRIE